MNPAPLTERQAQVLRFIRTAALEHGSPPTVREIAAHFRMASPKAAQDHLAVLERKGYITRTKHRRSRNISFTQPLSEGIPIVGAVAAGRAILAIEHLMGTLTFQHIFGSGELFAVIVKGDSMVDFGIMDGDHVIVRLQPVVETGTIAVAYLDGEATVKKVVRTHSGFQLVPGNDHYSPIEVDRTQTDFAIAGPVVGVVRTKVN